MITKDANILYNQTLHGLENNIVLFFSGSKMVTTGALETLDLFLGHIDKERQIRRITPQAYCRCT